MSVIDVVQYTPTALDSLVFQDVRNILEARMVSLGLDPEEETSWDEFIGEDAVDQLVQEITDGPLGALFLRELDELCVMRIVKLEGVLPGVINTPQATRAELIAALVRMERLFKMLTEKMDVLESNRGFLRGLLGKQMREDGVSELKATDSTGKTVANLKLEVKLRPSFPDKDVQLEFFEAIGQKAVIKSDVQWQTAEKLMDAFVHDDTTMSIHFDTEPSMESFEERRTEIAAARNLPAEGFGYAVVRPDTGGVRVLHYTGNEEFPFVPICSLFQTVNAKVTKLYG